MQIYIYNYKNRNFNMNLSVCAAEGRALEGKESHSVIDGNIYIVLPV